MTPSRSFDRAAAFYDQTRPFPEPAASLGIAAILEAAGPDAKILEAGTGTGRISIPLVEHGANLVGFDLSAGMLARLRHKSQSVKVVRAEAASIPFPTGSFDAVLTVHVMHLVSGWRGALSEFRRVLKPGGVYIDARTYEPAGGSARRRAREYWHAKMAERGNYQSHPGVPDRQVLLDELARRGAEITEVEAARYALTYTFSDELDRFRKRVYSDTWDIPEDIFFASLNDLEEWMGDQFGDLERIQVEEVRFILQLSRF